MKRVGALCQAKYLDRSQRHSEPSVNTSLGQREAWSRAKPRSSPGLQFSGLEDRDPGTGGEGGTSLRSLMGGTAAILMTERHFDGGREIDHLPTSL